MTIASVSNRWLNRLYKILAIMLVLLAVLISAFRLLLPYVEHYRQDFQQYINNSNQTNIVIGGLGMSWQRSGPTLIAKRVTLIDTQDAYVYIDHLEVQVDFWATLSTQQLISSNLLLEGAVVTLEQGIWHGANDNNKGDPSAQSSGSQLDGFQRITDIFLNRINRFSLINSQVSIENKALERKFRINSLNWLNTNKRHQAQGDITVDEISSNNLSLKIDMAGESIDELIGMMYIEANHLDITPWLDSVLAIDNNKTKTDIGFSTWLTINNGGIERLQLALHDNFISWQGKSNMKSKLSGEPHSLNSSAAQVLMVKGKAPSSFKLYTTPLKLQFDQQKEQEYIVQVNKTSAALSLYLSRFDLALISQVSPLFKGANSTHKLLSELDISGQADGIYVKKTATDIQALANFTETSSHYSQGIPGIDNLSGTISFADNNLQVNLTATQGALDFNKHFTAPIAYQSLAASIGLSVAEHGWQLQVNDLNLTSEELTLDADFAIESAKDQQATIALLANITKGDASKAGHYYPLTTMSGDLVEYLNGALLGGTISQAQVLLNGPLANFPFKDNSGVFVVDAELVNSRFKFSNEWPVIEDFSANLNFTNNSMLITGRAGQLSQLNVSGVQAAIDDLATEAVLTVDTLIEPSSAKNVARLMAQSPLKKSVGQVLEQLQINGDVRGEFHLTLPLKAKEKTLARGLIHFNDNHMSLQTPRMNFAQVTGQLRFENDKISTKNLSLSWQGLPLTLDVTGQDFTDYYGTNIELAADWQKDMWLPHISSELKQYVDGPLQLQGKLAMFQHHSGGFSYQFTVDSDLAQVELKLPTPYNKLPQSKVPLTIEVNGQLEQSTFNATYGEQLSFFGVLAHDTSHFSRVHVVLGNEKMLLPMDGFHITTNLEQADVSVWQPLISDIISSVAVDEQSASNSNSVQQPIFSKPERIRGTIGQLELFGQNLHNVSFNLLDKKNWWLLELNAKETRSQIKFYPDWLEQGLDINADFIQLTRAELDEVKNQSAQSINEQSTLLLNDDQVFANMPKMNFLCERCQIDNINLGKVAFSLLRSDENTIKIEQFTAKREQAELNLSGVWKKTGAASTTSVNGRLALNNIEYELEQLGYGSIIRDSGGKLAFDLNWQGGPHEFDFSALNGEINAKIDDGYLAEVSDKARIFSVLSLQSIVRKLALDFRDIFSDGMFYKDIKGDYHIKEGVLYTDNTRMNGSAGDLFIQGNTSFVTNMLDYKMSYKPNLTSSLPVLAWIATLNPVVFLAGVAIDQVITSKVVSELNFELTGSVSEPSFKEVNRKSRDVSVGRSKPPEFVDTSDNSTLLQPDTPKNKSFKEFN